MQIIKNSMIYLGSSIINKLIPFLLLPILTAYLTPAEYGMLSIYMIFITLYGAFVGMNMHINVSKEFFRVSKEQLALYIGNMLIILSVSTLLYFLLTLLSVPFIDTLFGIPTSWFLLLPFISMAMMIYNINTSLLRNEAKAYTFGIFEISNSAVTMATTLLFLLVWAYGWYAQIIGIALSYTLFALIGIVYMYRHGYLLLQFDATKIRSILAISVPLIPHVLGSVIITMSDRIFIEQMVSLEAVGIYSVGYLFGMGVLLFTDAFMKAWSPWFFKNLVDPTTRQKQRIVHYTYIYIVGVFILALGISLIGNIILPYVVDASFYGASEYIVWIALGYAVHGIYKIFFPYLVHLSKTSFLALSTMVAALLNLLFNYLLIDAFGAVGAAYATIISFLVSALLVFWYQHKYMLMPWFGNAS